MAFEPSLTTSLDLLESSIERIQRRGPDGHGLWRSPDGSVAFGHRRLSVIDTSDSGSQPMRSPFGGDAITFNGEIYNHLDLRRRLESDNAVPSGGWQGSSDTETLLVALRAWGVEATLKAAIGMFAFGYWDGVTHELVLARDRFGEKPLYITRIGRGLAFGSELKAIDHLPGFNRAVNQSALNHFLIHGYVQAPSSIYAGTMKLLQGSYVRLSEQDVAGMDRVGDFIAPHLKFYWRLVDVARGGIKNPFSGDDEEAIDQLGVLLTNAVRRQQLSDVPLGAFLSGGIDSTAVVALMQSTSTRPVKTFTISFDERDYDESMHAEAVARHLGTDHTTAEMTTQAALDRIPLLASIWDEPFADVSQLPTLLVSEVARRDVTVALTGDGGDELFAGYDRYQWTVDVWSKLGSVPQNVRRIVAKTMLAFPQSSWDRLFGVLPGGLSSRVTGDRVHRIAALLPARNPGDLYEGTLSSWKGLEPLLLEGEPARVPHWSGYPDMGNLVLTMMLRDSLDYMPDDVLVKVDRAAMRMSLETRAPLLDPAVTEFAWSLPLSFKLRNGVGKWILRKLVHRHVPPHLVERPKSGFGVPIHLWLRGPLRSWAESLLSPQTLTAAGLNAKPIRNAWEAHVAGKADHQYFLWHVLSYVAWREERR